jgi:uncharacterized protein YcfJ
MEDKKMKRVFYSLVLAGGLTVAMFGCNTTPGQDGAIVGTALGAGLGAIVGNQSGHAGEGALIGGAAGALTGGLIGREVGQKDGYPSRRYETAPPPSSSRNVEGHYENRVVHHPNGAITEERVWVPHR